MALKVRQRRPLSLLTEGGFTFMEIMVTLLILSVGILGVYKAFFASLDQMSRLNSRLYANILLEDRIATLERTLRVYKTLPMEFGGAQEVDVGVKKIIFEPEVKIGEVEMFTNVYKVDFAYSWDDGGPVRLSRSAYISDFFLDDKTPQ